MFTEQLIAQLETVIALLDLLVTCLNARFAQATALDKEHATAVFALMMPDLAEPIAHAKNEQPATVRFYFIV